MNNLILQTETWLWINSSRICLSMFQMVWKQTDGLNKCTKTEIAFSKIHSKHLELVNVLSGSF